MRQTRVGSFQREGSVRQLPHSENTWFQALVKGSVEQSSRAGVQSRIASVLPRLIQGLVLLGQMALQQDDTITACSLLEASATLIKQMEEWQDCAELLSLLTWVVDLQENNTGQGVLPKESLTNVRKGYNTEVPAFGMTEVSRDIMTSEPATRSALISRKLRLVPASKRLVSSSTGLTAREMKVLHLVAKGLSDTQIAKQLVISPRTVNWHLTTIYSKLGVSSRIAATRFAIEHHLI